MHTRPSVSGQFLHTGGVCRHFAYKAYIARSRMHMVWMRKWLSYFQRQHTWAEQIGASTIYRDTTGRVNVRVHFESLLLGPTCTYY